MGSIKKIQNAENHSVPQIRAKIQILKKELMGLRFQKVTKPMEDTSGLRKIRREVARLFTLQNSNLN